MKCGAPRRGVVGRRRTSRERAGVPVEVLDSTGAGDAFAAGVLAARPPAVTSAGCAGGRQSRWPAQALGAGRGAPGLTVSRW